MSTPGMPCSRSASASSWPSSSKQCVGEVVRHDPGERQPPAQVLVPRRRHPALLVHAEGVLPGAPVVRRLLAHRRVGALQQPVVGGDEVAVPVRVGQAAPEACPRPRGRTGRHRGRASRSRPLVLFVTATRTISLTRSGCCLGVGKRERRAPGGAAHQPALDAEVLAQLLEVGDQVLGRVGGEVGASGRSRAACCGRSCAGRAARCGRRQGRSCVARRGCSPSRGHRAGRRRACRRGCRRSPSRRGCRRRRRACPCSYGSIGG